MTKVLDMLSNESVFGDLSDDDMDDLSSLSDILEKENPFDDEDSNRDLSKLPSDVEIISLNRADSPIQHAYLGVGNCHTSHELAYNGTLDEFDEKTYESASIGNDFY